MHLSVLALATLFLCGAPLLTRADVPELPPIPSDKTTPVQQRLGYHGATKMAIGWNTFQKINTPTVYYGFTPNKLYFKVSSHSSITYPTSRTWANTVLVENLLPATMYYYKIESTNSSIDSFKTGRAPGDHTPFNIALVIDMGVFGTYGLTINEMKRSNIPIAPELKHTTIDRLVQIANQYDFVLHPGDLSYADQWIDGETKGIDPGNITDGVQIYEGLVEQFYDQLSVVSRMKPYMVGPGNHEADCNEDPTKQYLCPTGQTNFTGYINRFQLIMPTAPSQQVPSGKRTNVAFAEGGTLPRQSGARRASANSNNENKRNRDFNKRGAASLANPPFWYSFDYGMAHVVIFNTETDFGNGLVGPEELGGATGLNDGPFGSTMNQQIEFLKKDLASVDRKITPWVIAAGHRPWYTVGGGCTICQQAFEPILNEYGVDLVVMGHVHNMQRLIPVANNKTDPAGLNNPTAPWYIITGAAGNLEGRSPLGNISAFPNYVAWASDAYYGFSLLKFIDREHIEIQFIRSDNGDLLDSATLFKKH